MFSIGAGILALLIAAMLSSSIMRAEAGNALMQEISGHIHEDYGIKDLGGTICVNPGPAMDKRAAIITVTDDQVAVKLIGPEGA